MGTGLGSSVRTRVGASDGARQRAGATHLFTVLIEDIPESPPALFGDRYGCAEVAFHLE